MYIQINSDHNVDGTLELSRYVRKAVRGVLGRFGGRITRVEVHVGDVNSHKLGSDDKRCMLEARLAGLKPIAVTEQAPSIEAALSGALDKLERKIEHTLGRLDETAGRAPGEAEIASLEQLRALEGRGRDGGGRGQ